MITKCGSRVNIKLTKEEQKFLDMAEDCKTWDDVVVCEAIYEWSKEMRLEMRLMNKSLSKYDFDDEESDEEEDEYESMGGDESDDERR